MSLERIKWMHYGLSMEAIHADWPTYPTGHGMDIALKTVCLFPPESRLVEISDIDRCSLLLRAPKPTDPFDSKHRHVAIWHKELIELAEMGLVDGVRGENEYQAALAQHRILEDLVAKGAYILMEDGRKEPIRIRDPPAREDYLEAEEADNERPHTHALIHAAGLMVTQKGWAYLEKRCTTRAPHPWYAGRVAPLVALGQHDTAIREASVILESKLREKFARDSKSFGEALLAEVFSGMTERDGGTTAYNLGLRSELRTLFAFVRNEFAHNLVPLTLARCNVLLERLSDAADSLQPYWNGAPQTEPSR